MATFNVKGVAALPHSSVLVLQPTTALTLTAAAGSRF